MGYQYQHSGGGMTLRLDIGQMSIEAPCPTCAEVGKEGTLRLQVDETREQGGSLLRCENGHMVFVNWTRAEA